MKRGVFVSVFVLLLFSKLVAMGEGLVEESKLNANTQHFNILIGDNKIGDFDIVKIQKDTKTSYFATSYVEVSFVKQFTFAYTLNCVFEGEKLIRSKFILIRNGIPTDSTIIDWTGSNYVIVKNEETFYMDNPIYSTAVELYYDEPIGTTQVFSEKEGEYMAVEKSQLELFKLLAPGQSRHIDYRYQSNRLKEVVVDLTVTDFKMIRD